MILSTPQVMGVLNTTPDSFSDGGKYLTVSAAVNRAEQMLEQGVDILDLGAESTRPGAPAIGAAEQLDRLLPVVQELIKLSDTPLSIDTSEPEVFRQAYHLGAKIWNDTRSLSLPGAAELAADLQVDVVIMHRRGEDHAAPSKLKYQDLTGEVIEALKIRVAQLQAIGIHKERIIIDPGFGFSKDSVGNFELLGRLNELQSLGCPVLVGVSKKRMLAYALRSAGLSDDLNARIEPGLSCAVVAVAKGARFIRTHDVAATKRALSIFHTPVELSL